MIRRPCRICGNADIPKYKRANGTPRRECKKCHTENVNIAREKRYQKNPEAEREKYRLQVRAWRAKNKKKRINLYSRI